MADLVILPSIFYCMVYPFDNAMYRKKKQVLLPPSTKLSKIILRKTTGPIHLSDVSVVGVRMIKGDMDTYSFDRTDPYLIYMIEMGLFEDTLYVSYVNNAQCWHIELVDGEEAIFYHH